MKTFKFLGYKLTTTPTENGYQAIASTTSYGGACWDFEAPTEREAIALAKERVARDWATGASDNFLANINPNLESCQLVFLCGNLAQGVVRVIAAIGL
jgi:hypothetical protein